MKMTRRSFLKLTGTALIAPVIITSLSEAQASIPLQVKPDTLDKTPSKTYLNPTFDINAIVCYLYELHGSYQTYFNDSVTRAQLFYQVTDYLRHLQVNRQLQEFAVVCDDRNNPVSVLDSQDLVLDVHLKSIVPWCGEFYLTFSYKDTEDPRDLPDARLLLDVIFVTNSFEAAEQKAKESPFIVPYLLDKSATEEHCRIVHSVLCKFWTDKCETATISPATVSEQITGRKAVLTYAELNQIPLRSLHLTYAVRDKAHAACINVLHYIPSAGFGPFLFGNYAWSNGQPLRGITVGSLLSRGVIFL